MKFRDESESAWGLFLTLLVCLGIIGEFFPFVYPGLNLFLENISAAGMKKFKFFTPSTSYVNILNVNNMMIYGIMIIFSLR